MFCGVCAFCGLRLDVNLGLGFGDLFAVFVCVLLFWMLLGFVLVCFIVSFVLCLVFVSCELVRHARPVVGVLGSLYGA